MTRRVAIGERPAKDSGAATWIRCGEDRPASTVAVAGADRYSARLTIDVTPELRGRIKVAAFRQGLTVADMLRAFFEREFPDGESKA